jgi:hypothetical protein
VRSPEKTSESASHSHQFATNGQELKSDEAGQLREDCGMTSTLPDAQKTIDERWRFWRDVLVFELKMFIGNLRDFTLMPVSAVAAMIDLVSKGEREGSLFYRVLRWGAHSEEVLDAYSPIRDELQDRKVNPNYTVDAVVARLEGVLVREYEKGGTAATIKAALDRTIDQLHRETGVHRERAQNVVVKALEEGKRLKEGVIGKKEGVIGKKEE